MCLFHIDFKFLQFYSHFKNIFQLKRQTTILTPNIQQMSMKKYNFCTTELKTASEKFVWTIKNFSEHQEKCGECLESTEFTSTAPNGQNIKWKLQIYPNGYNEESKDCIGLYLFIFDSNHEEVNAKFQFSVRKSSGDEFVRAPLKKEWHNFSANKCWGYGKFFKREDLLNANDGLIDGDRLTIECTVMVQQKLVEKAPLPDIEVPECRMPEDIGYLFEQSLFWDCKIKTEDEKEFKVHKCILGCRSPVFAAMFEHEMIEKNNNEVKIEDMKGDVIEKMLRFIYSGKEPDMDDELAIALLEAADKYELTRLKLLCERKLINSLGSANVCELLMLANLYQAEHLKTQAIGFIKMHMNEVLESEGWKTLADDPLKDQILKAMAK